MSRASRMWARCAWLCLVAVPACGSPSLVDETLGRPGEAAAADRVIEVLARTSIHQDYSFLPTDVSVAVGETVTFRVENVSAIQHEFFIGTAEAQEQHGERVKSGHTFQGLNKIDLPPGASRELTWTFERPGSVLFACHVGVPSHYREGMVGTIVVEERG